MQINIPLTEPQKRFVFSKAKFPAMVAGLGAGKSQGAIVRCIVLLAENVQATGKQIDILYTMPTYDLLKLRAIPGFEELLLNSGIPFKTNKSDFCIDIEYLGRVIFRSYDRPERIVAFEVGHAVADELDTLPKEKAEFVFRKIAERVRQKTYKPNSIAVPSTPDQGYNGFVYQRWYKNKSDDFEVIKAPTYSNPYLPDGYVEQIKANYDPLLAQMYIEGDIVNLSADKVYHFFDRVKNHSDRELSKDDYEIMVSVDFNVGGCCSTVNVLESGFPIQVEEFVSKNTYDFIDNLKVKYPDKKVTVYPDATGDSDSTNASASDIKLIEQAGYLVDAPNGNPRIRDRVNSVNKLISHGEYKINTNKCPKTTHALETQGYGKDGKPEKFNEHPSIDDWTDTLGYFINRRYPIDKPVINTNLFRAF